jgi:hypothetical protein
MEVIAIEMPPRKSGLNKEFPINLLYGLRFSYKTEIPPLPHV